MRSPAPGTAPLSCHPHARAGGRRCNPVQISSDSGRCHRHIRRGCQVPPGTSNSTPSSKGPRSVGTFNRLPCPTSWTCRGAGWWNSRHCTICSLTCPPLRFAACRGTRGRTAAGATSSKARCLSRQARAASSVGCKGHPQASPARPALQPASLQRVRNTPRRVQRAPLRHSCRCR